MKVWQEEKNTGFTLIEMLIAVMIFSVSLAALISSVSASLKTSRNFRDHVIASYLALEGIELIHNIRDRMLLSRGVGNLDWELVFNGKDNIFGGQGCFDGSGSCNLYIDSTGSFQLGIEGTEVYFDESMNRYLQFYEGHAPSNAKPTKFKRLISMRSNPNNPSEIVVFVVIKYPDVAGNAIYLGYSENLFLYQ